MHTSVGAGPRRARTAVSILFCVNGALIASLLARLPTVKANLDLSNAALGAGLASAPAGALLASVVAGRAVARFGSGRLAVGASVGYGVALPLVGLAPAWAAFAATVFVFGICDAFADVGQNAHGLRVQRVYGRSLINGFHAWWSIGGVLGAGSSALAAALDVPLAAHLGVAGAVLALAALAAGRWTLAGGDPGADHAGPPAAADLGTGPRRARPPIVALAGLGALTLLAAIVEDVPGSWGAVYLRDGLGATAGTAALAFAAFTAGMTAARLAADRVVDRLGHVSVVRAGGALAAASLAVALLAGTWWAGLAGFFLVGVGAAASFPALFHAAGHRPGVRPADGIALISWSGRAGFLIAPPLVGIFADAVGLAWAVGLGAVAAACVATGAKAALRAG
ncbi:MAG: MFS transporter [bacterium]